MTSSFRSSGAARRSSSVRAERGLIACGLVALSLALGACTDNVSDNDIVLMPVAEVRQLSKSTKADAVRFLDPRTPEEFARGRLPNAENLRLPEVSEKSGSLDPRLGRFGTLVVYGNDPGTLVARAMTKRLIRAGAKDVKLFAGGLSEWTKSGYPVERDPESDQAPASPAPSSAPPSSAPSSSAPSSSAPSSVVQPVTKGAAPGR